MEEMNYLAWCVQLILIGNTFKIALTAWNFKLLVGEIILSDWLSEIQSYGSTEPFFEIFLGARVLGLPFPTALYTANITIINEHVPDIK